MPISFGSPLWLLVLLTLPLLVWWSLRSLAGLSRYRRITAITLRSAIVVLVIFALAEIKFVSGSGDLFVYYILDLSNSMPPGTQEKACEYIKKTTESMNRRDRAGLIVFGGYSSIEYQPDLDKKQAPLEIRRIDSAVNGEYTNIASALRLAAGSFPENYRKRVVLISDGEENVAAASGEAEFAGARGVQVCVLPITLGSSKDVLIERLIAPDEINEKEPFEIKTVIFSTHAGKARLRILENGYVLADEVVELSRGRSVFICPRTIEKSSASFASYEAIVEPLEALAEERVPENNRAQAVTIVRGSNRILFVHGGQGLEEDLANMLKAEGFDVVSVKPSGLPATLAGMQSYNAIVLANVPRLSITEDQDKILEIAARDMGVGLVMIGGEDSFGAGDWLGSAVERALPVTMDVKERKVMPSGALVLIMHTCEFPDGNTWAKRVAEEAIKVLNENDYAGLLFYDGTGLYKWLFPVQKVGVKARLFSMIRNNLSPQDMPDFEPTIQMAYKALKTTPAGVKHVVIISDGDPQPAGDLVLGKMKESRITISTVTIYPHENAVPNEMVRLVEKTRSGSKGGEVYWPKTGDELPKIFIKEAKVVKRSLISEGRFVPKLASVGETIRGIEESGFPAVLGYVLTTAKPRSTVPLLVGEENDPLLAHWNYGVGKSLAFTSDSAGPWGAEWVSWEKYKKFWTQGIRWVTRSLMDTEFAVSSSISGEKGKISVNAVGKNGKFINVSEYEPLKKNFPDVSQWSLKARIAYPHGEAPPQVVEVRQTGPGRYEGDFDAAGEGTRFVYVYLEGMNDNTGEFEKRGIYTSGLVVPYSPEYKSRGDGIKILKDAASETKGKILTGNPSEDGPAIFDSSDLEVVYIFEDAWPGALMLAFLLLPLDVFVRRVYIDWTKLRRAAMAFVSSPFRRRKPEDSEGRIERLLALKEDLKKKEEKMKEEYSKRAVSTLPPEAAAKEKPAAAGAAEPPKKPGAAWNFEGEPSGTLEFKKKEEPGKPGAAPEKKTEPPAEGGGGFTSRLLEAKKRAMKDKDKKSEDNKENK